MDYEPDSFRDYITRRWADLKMDGLNIEETGNMLTDLINLISGVIFGPLILLMFIH